MMTIDRTVFHRLWRWVKEHRTRSIVGVGVFLITSAAAVAYALLIQPLPPIDTTPLATHPKPKYYSPLTGLKVQQQSDETKPVTAIMIENSPDARPQSGLKQAEVVYEAIAEGGITRFLCLYQQNKPQLIGPVRSVRPYYLDWARPYDASIAHVGGSSLALQQVRNGSWRDIDQFFNGAYYWRASDRYAPHNVYTSFAKLDALNKAKGFKHSNPKPFLRADPDPAKKVTARTIQVRISGPLYDSSYRYNAKNNNYIRYEGGVQHKDREKGVITPTAVVILGVDMAIKWEDTYRETVKTIGSGKATIFQNGEVIKATWHKDSQSRGLSFTDADGKSVALTRGQTWITAIPNGSGNVSWTK